MGIRGEGLGRSLEVREGGGLQVNRGGAPGGLGVREGGGAPVAKGEGLQ